MIAILCVVVSALFSLQPSSLQPSPLQPSPLQPSPSVEGGGLPNRSLSPVSQLPMLEVARSNTPSEFQVVGKNLPANQTGTFTLTNAVGDAFSYVFTTSAEGDVNSVQYIFAEADSWQVDWQVASVSGMTRLVWEDDPVRLELTEAPVTPPTDTSSVDAAPETASPTTSLPETTSADTSLSDTTNALAVTETPDTDDVETLELTSPLADETSPDNTSLAAEPSVEETPTPITSTEEPSTPEIPTPEIPTPEVTTETASPEPSAVEAAPTETPSTETPSTETPSTETASPIIRPPPPAWLVALTGSSWYLTFAVILAIIGLRLTLLCKYWVAQSEDIEAYWREHKRVPKLARLNIMNYFSVAEKLTLLGLFVVALLLAVLAHWADSGFATSLNATFQQALRNPWAALAGANPPQLASLVWQISLGVFFVAAAVHLVGLVLPRPERAGAPKGTPLYGLFAVLIPGSGLAARGYGILLILAWVVMGTSVLRQLYNLPDILNLGIWGGFWALGIVYGLNLLLLLTHYILGRRQQARVMQPAKA